MVGYARDSTWEGIRGYFDRQQEKKRLLTMLQ